MKEKGETRTKSRVGEHFQAANDPRISRSASGQSLLEVALLLPILLAMLLGSIELGRYAYLSILVGNAARAGASFGAQNLALSADIPGIVAAAESDFQSNGQDPTSLTVAPSTSCGCDSGGSIPTTTSICSTQLNPGIGGTITSCPGNGGHWVVMVSVKATGNFNSLFNYPVIPNTLRVSSTATLRVPQI